MLWKELFSRQFFGHSRSKFGTATPINRQAIGGFPTNTVSAQPYTRDRFEATLGSRIAPVGRRPRPVSDYAPANPVHFDGDFSRQNLDAICPMNDIAFQRDLHQRAIALRCRATELADALQRFRERQQQIETGSTEALIRMPPVAAGWLVDFFRA